MGGPISLMNHPNSISPKQAEEQTKQAEAKAKQAEELTKQLLLLSRLNTNMNEFEPEQISNMNGFRHTVK